MLLAVWLWCGARLRALLAPLVAPVVARLIPDWRRSTRLWSVRLSAAGAALLALAIGVPDVVTGVWAVLPPEVLDRLPRNVALLLPLAVQVAAGVARVIRQRSAPLALQATSGRLILSGDGKIDGNLTVSGE